MGKKQDKDQPQIQAYTYERSGPLPEAREFGQYETVLPGSADRILKMAEKEQEFRHDRTNYVTRKSYFTKNLGQILGFIVCITVIIAGFYLINNDKSIEGSGAVLVGVSMIIGAFIADRKSRDKAKNSNKE